MSMYSENTYSSPFCIKDAEDGYNFVQSPKNAVRACEVKLNGIFCDKQQHPARQGHGYIVNRVCTFLNESKLEGITGMAIIFQELAHLYSFTLDRVETILHHKAECGVCAVPLHAENLHTPPNFAHHILYRKIVFKSSLFAYFVHDEIVSFLSALDLPSYLEY